MPTLNVHISQAHKDMIADLAELERRTIKAVIANILDDTLAERLLNTQVKKR